MRQTAKMMWRVGVFGLLLALLTTAMVFNAGSIVLAQSGPTPTPNNVTWRGYSAVRAAIQEEFGVDLSLVREYTYEQAEFSYGIDDCATLDNPAAARPIYFGWVYTLTDVSGKQYQGRISFDLRDVAVCDEVNQVISAVPAAPATAPTTNTNLPAAVASTAGAGGFELGGHVLQLNSNTVALARSARMTWVKKQVTHSRGANATEHAGFISEAHANGFKVLLGVVGDKNALAADTAGYTADYASYVAGLTGLGADAIEVWNEPNIDREWAVGQINGANYTQLLAAASNAIRNASSSTLVISGAPAPTGFFGAAGCTANGCNDDVFMQQMAAAGAAQYLDCVGLHYNEGIVSPNQVGGDPRGEYPSYYYQSMTQRGYGLFGGKPVCYTELGFLSGEGYSLAIPPAFGWAGNTSLAEHAQWLGEAARAARTSGNVRIMIVWNVDFNIPNPSDPMWGYSILRADGGCPACATLAAAMQ